LKFLALIIAVGLLQYWGSAGPVHRDDWFKSLVDKVAGSGLMSELQLALAVLFPVAVIFWLQSLVTGWLLGLVPLALTVVVLLYSFGRRDFESLLEQYRGHCRDGDFEGAFLFAQQELGSGSEKECPSSAEELHRWVKERICYLGFERWFGVIFYFALFGAAGALGYRLLHLYREMRENPEQERMVCRVLYWVDWVPARLLVLAFGLTGDWVGSREQLTASFQDMDSSTADVLADGAHAALGLKATVFSGSGDTEAVAEVADWEIGQLQSLFSRSAMAWVVVLALLVLLV
jgi:AmpE protein